MIKMTNKLTELMNELKRTNPDTFYHCLRVKRLAYEMLRKTNHDGITTYSEKEISIICKGALLHDIGKLYVENSVLTKASALEDDEMANMRQHTLLGCLAIEGELCNDEREIVLGICRWHHERRDGSGYESKRDIPLYIEIVALCDVFDALHSDRVYRKGLSEKKSLEMIKELHFGDESLVECLGYVVEEQRGNYAIH